MSTEIEIREVLIPWRIEGFDSYCKISENNSNHYLKKSFEVPNKNCRWTIGVYPFDASSKEDIDILIACSTNEQESLQTHVKIDLMDADGKCLVDSGYRSASTGYVKGNNHFQTYVSFKRDRILPLKDDVLVINTWLKWDINKFDVNKSNYKIKLSNDLSKLMQSSSFSDVVLIANDGVEFSAHKCILVSRSPVFAAMFNHGMDKQQESRVEIDDIDASTLRVVLQHIYSSNFDKDKIDIAKVLAAADKYSLENLKEICELELIDDLKIENAVDHLILADKYDLKLLKDRALIFISQYLNKVYETNSFKELKVVNPCLLEEILGLVSATIKK